MNWFEVMCIDLKLSVLNYMNQFEIMRIGLKLCVSV